MAPPWGEVVIEDGLRLEYRGFRIKADRPVVDEEIEFHALQACYEYWARERSDMRPDLFIEAGGKVTRGEDAPEMASLYDGLDERFGPRKDLAKLPTYPHARRIPQQRPIEINRYVDGLTSALFTSTVFLTISETSEPKVTPSNSSLRSSEISLPRRSSLR